MSRATRSSPLIQADVPVAPIDPTKNPAACRRPAADATRDGPRKCEEPNAACPVVPATNTRRTQNPSHFPLLNHSYGRCPPARPSLARPGRSRISDCTSGSARTVRSETASERGPRLPRSCAPTPRQIRSWLQHNLEISPPVPARNLRTVALRSPTPRSGHPALEACHPDPRAGRTPSGPPSGKPDRSAAGAGWRRRSTILPTPGAYVWPPPSHPIAMHQTAPADIDLARGSIDRNRSRSGSRRGHQIGSGADLRSRSRTQGFEFRWHTEG